MEILLCVVKLGSDADTLFSSEFSYWIKFEIILKKRRGVVPINDVLVEFVVISETDKFLLNLSRFRGQFE